MDSEVSDGVIVDSGGQESWVAVALHESVDLVLGLIEGRSRWTAHVGVDNLTDAGVQGDLLWGEDRDEILVDDAGLRKIIGCCSYKI